MDARSGSPSSTVHWINREVLGDRAEFELPSKAHASNKYTISYEASNPLFAINTVTERYNIHHQKPNADRFSYNSKQNEIFEESEEHKFRSLSSGHRRRNRYADGDVIQQKARNLESRSYGSNSYIGDSNYNMIKRLSHSSNVGRNRARKAVRHVHYPTKEKSLPAVELLQRKPFANASDDVRGNFPPKLQRDGHRRQDGDITKHVTNVTIHFPNDSSNIKIENGTRNTKVQSFIETGIVHGTNSQLQYRAPKLQAELQLKKLEHSYQTRLYMNEDRNPNNLLNNVAWTEDKKISYPPSTLSDGNNIIQVNKGAQMRKDILEQHTNSDSNYSRQIQNGDVSRQIRSNDPTDRGNLSDEISSNETDSRKNTKDALENKKIQENINTDTIPIHPEDIGMTDIQPSIDQVKISTNHGSDNPMEIQNRTREARSASVSDQHFPPQPDKVYGILILRQLLRTDGGNFHCRVDFREAPTRHSQTHLTVIGKWTKLSPLRLFIDEKILGVIRVNFIHKLDLIHCLCICLLLPANILQ